ncbi:MAG: ROK family protein [Clostridia bacterium]|nr:ROK family protein [Clostridia bacterium]
MSSKDIIKIVAETKDYLWGGNKLRDYGKVSDKDKIAESWELSYHKDGPSKTLKGELLSEVLMPSDLGKNANDFKDFPVLVKLIDSADNLSVQVHPSDDFALKNEGQFGKTEMWYIVDCDEGAGIYLGLKEDTDKEVFEKAIQDGTVTNLLNFYEVKKGDWFFIKSGTIHAIGKGVTVCEIQQNSNLTYRVYDFKRKGPDGKERPLHVEKALTVSNFTKFTNCKLDVEMGNKRLIGASKYFSAYFTEVDGDEEYLSDKNSFTAVTCIEGSGEIEKESISKGDTYFVPASYGEFKIEGKLKCIMTQVRKYYIGIDLGGTFIKGGICDDLGNLIATDKIPTETEKGEEKVMDNISTLALSLLDKVGLLVSDVEGLGMGVPGMIDSRKGVVIFYNNFNWKDVRICDGIKSRIGLDAVISNDANVAALGEAIFGSGKEFDDMILLTLGTGVGGGIIVDNQLIEGNKGAGAELGHAVIEVGGEQCTCGRKGCFEAYASANAIIRDTKRAMENHKDSKMWEIGGLDKVTGKVAFDYKDVDKYAKQVVDNYIEKLACGIVNYANIFRPHAVVLGGGVCAQGDNLIRPLQKIVDREVFAGELGPKCEVRIASLENSAGILGAVALVMNKNS